MARKRKPADIPTGLAYVGPGVYRGVPARDLTPHDLARVAYRRALSWTAADGQRPPTTPQPAAVAAITAELIGSGLYSPHTEADRP